VIDVEDCIDVATHLADSGRVDRDRLAVRGGSAGGYVVLSALAFHDELAAGTSYFGVADLARLTELTHKFESRYLDQLVGPYPDVADTYEARSPVHHADGIDAPALLLQGEDDQVVPLSQAEEMAEALAASDVPHDLRVFEDEQHGFRRAESRKRAHEAELAFYGDVFGFEPAGDALPDLDLSVNGDA
jgi:dipeptidyl aminopeptidase/acylaminoacyl peptidase